MGYAHLSRLASERPEEAYVEWTPSIELWDENVPRDKIQHMSEYLKDVSATNQARGRLILTSSSSEFCPKPNYHRE